MKDPAMADDSSDRNPVEELAEEFLARFRRGERPALSKYIRGHPDLADEIRELFPALVMLEDVRPPTAAATGAADGSAVFAAGKKLERLGDYRILREVGRGGMGIVYEAEQESLGRHVALKVLPAQTLLDARHLLRFQREARAAARLHHTNIVPVFGVGEHDGLHYYVMQFIHGQGLDQVLAELHRLHKRAGLGSTGPHVPARSAAGSAAEVARSLLTGIFALHRPTMVGEPVSAGAEVSGALTVDPAPLFPGPGREGTSSTPVHLPGQPEDTPLSDSGQPYWHSVARIGIQVADALSYAHAQGTLHRDIKPSNLLLDTQGIVWVTDFGLAKAADSEDLTHTGDVVGTLRYMAPERLGGKGDARSDVYSLGLTLYELLTLRPAYDESERSRLLHQAMRAEPPRPRKLNPAVPRDLETIVLKAIARDPAHRYQTADELADDLRCFTDDKPIRARRVSEIERLWRWCRRNPVEAGLVALVLVSLTLGSAGIAWKWREAESERQKVVKAEHETANQRDAAIGARNESDRRLADVMLDRGIALAEQGEVGEGLVWMLEALRKAPADAADQTRVIQANLAGWSGLAHSQELLIELPEPSGQCAFCSDGKQVAASIGKSITFWETATGRRLDTPVKPDGQANAVLSPDGKLILTTTWQGITGPGQVQRWERQTGKALGAPLLHPQGIRYVVFAPDSKQFATACSDGVVRLWDSATGKLVSDRFRPTGAPAIYLAFSPDGRTLAGVPQADRQPDVPAVACLWKVAGDERPVELRGQQAGFSAVAFSPDGRSVVTGRQDGTAQLWDAATGLPRSYPMKHTHTVRVVRFTPDGRTIATGSEDGVVRWWDAATGAQLVGSLALRGPPVYDLALSPDGRSLVAVSGGGQGGTLHVYRLARTLSRPPLKGQEVSRKAPWVPLNYQAWWRWKYACYSPDATRVLTGHEGHARLTDTATGQPAFPAGAGLRGPFRLPWEVVQVNAYSPDGRLFASSSRQGPEAVGEAWLWEAASGRPIGPPLVHLNYVATMAFSPDSRLLVSGGYDRALYFWDTATGQRLGPPLPMPNIVLNVAFSPDGKTLAISQFWNQLGADGLLLLDVASRRPVGPPIPTPAGLVVFSPDSRRVLVAAGRSVKMWDVATRQPVGEPFVEAAEINCVVYHPDGRMIAVCCSDGTARLLDPDSGKPLGAPMVHPVHATVAAFSRDPGGRLLVVGYEDGSARLWDRATQKPLGALVVQDRPILAATFTPDGRSFLTTTADGSTRRWPVPAAEPLTTDQRELLALRLQVRTGLKLGEGQTVVQLSAAEWRQQQQELAAQEDSAAGLDDYDYHDARARDAEQAGASATAAWHLDRLIEAQEQDPAAAHSPTAWLAYARRARCAARRGDYARAEADYARALELGSSDLLAAWYRHCARDDLQRRDWPAALWHLDRAIAAAPADAASYADRSLAQARLGNDSQSVADLNRAVKRGADGAALLPLANVCAEKGRWDQVAAALNAAGERGTLPLIYRHHQALVCVRAGDRAAYRRVCAGQVQEAGPTPSGDLGNAVAWVCVLGPDAVDDFSRPIALAEAAVRQAPPHLKAGILNTLGAVLYRAGRFRDAIDRLNEGIKLTGTQGGVHDWIFLAMAHYRLGETAGARKFLARAMQYQPEEKGRLWDELEIDVLRREAQALIEGTKK
jgi:WD40 repeat protein/serine/threonine protein kinase/tetratricopeptide (TPR) repeat protein